MSILWLSIEIIINCFQGWLYTFFLRKQLTQKAHRSQSNVVVSTVITILAVATFYSFYIWIDIPITDSVVFVLTFIYSIYLFSNKWYIKLLWNIVLGVLLVAIASFTATILINIAGVSWEMIMNPSLLRLAFLLCGNAVLFVACYTITRIKPHQEKLSWYALGLFLILNIILLIAMEMQYHLSWQPNVPRKPVLITIFCMLFVIAGILAMFELLSCRSCTAL